MATRWRHTRLSTEVARACQAVPFTPHSTDVTIKLLRVDPVSGQLRVILSAPGGTGLGTHRHYGSVVVYTIRSAWRYLENDWVSPAGAIGADLKRPLCEPLSFARSQ